MSKILIKMMCEDNLHDVTVGHIYTRRVFTCILLSKTCNI